MRLHGKNDDQLLLSATDLQNHLGCRHLTHLAHRAVFGERQPPSFVDPTLAILAERGERHEAEYLAHLRRLHGSDAITTIEFDDPIAVEATIDAMRTGARVIYQANLRLDRWAGYADFLVRTDEQPSALGPFSYEVQDTKLARTTRAGSILQLCLYSEMVAAIQGRHPERMHIVKPWVEYALDSYRFLDFAAYFRSVQAQLLATLAADPRHAEPPTYPEPVAHCDICRWRPECNSRRRTDEHLSLVAGMQSIHAHEFASQARDRWTTLGAADSALDSAPARGHLATFDKLHQQARVQLEAKQAGNHVVEHLPFEPGRGLGLLPEPDPGDVFFDIEGDPFVGEHGLEYLLGYCTRDDAGTLIYDAAWAKNAAEEKRCFVAFIDAMIERLTAHPNMHVYHFAPYEPAAVRRLMGRHGTREDEVDRLLRGGRFVDLHAVARQGLRISVERYGLKELEAVFGYCREQDLDSAGDARRRIETALELANPVEATSDDRTVVENYNREDCMATAALRDWLEAQRATAIRNGAHIQRPMASSGEAPDGVARRNEQVAAVFDALTESLPEDPAQHDPDQAARWLLAQSLDYFRREAKVAWWQFFERRAYELEDALHDRKAIGGATTLGPCGTAGKRKKKPIIAFAFPAQEVSIDAGDEIYLVGGGPELEGPKSEGDASKLGEVHGIDEPAGRIEIVGSPSSGGSAPTGTFSMFAHRNIRHAPLEQALLDLGERVAGLRPGAPSPRAALDLLLRRPPRLTCSAHEPLRRPGENVADAAIRLARKLDQSVLAIQGPPGTGKTYVGAQVIRDLHAAGKRIGVVATSHKVILNLLATVHRQATEAGTAVPLAHRGHDEETLDQIDFVSNIAQVAPKLDQGFVVGGTAWTWSNSALEDQLDYLFVDEAGQMALAFVLAASRSTRNLVLLGDPAQLEQPQQGAHPPGTDVSALEHLLGGEQTMPADRGLFLDQTWRLHPTICEFTSLSHYDGRLQSRPGLDAQRLVGPGPFSGSGLFYVPVHHTGNQSESGEEARAVARIVSTLCNGAHSWIDVAGARHPLVPTDILIVAPYNAQIAALRREPGLASLRIGTVDKFQGQEAVVVIYSMTSSSPVDAPRGMSFLYNPNRLNVATSRARCAVVLVASEALFEPDCRTPEQMRHANGLCLFREMARVIPPDVRAMDQSDS